MQISRKLKQLAMFAAGGLAFAGAAHGEESVADFYKGKQMSLLVGSAPGGGYDLYARHVARYFAKHVPGHPDLVVQNMPGAGGLIVANHLYNRAPKDGSTIGLVQGPLTVRQIAGSKNVMYDMRKFGWLGSANDTSNVCVFSNRVKIEDPKDLLSKEIIIGASGGSTSYIPAFLNAVAGTKFKIVSGYKSTSNVVIAIESGEVNGLCGWGWDSVKANAKDFLDRGIIKVGLESGTEPHPELAAKNVPFVLDLVENEENKKLLEFAFGYLVYIRPFVTPPDLPQDRLEALQKAFAETMKDPEFLAEAAKNNVEIRYSSPERVRKALDRSFNAPDALKKRAIVKLREAGLGGL